MNQVKLDCCKQTQNKQKNHFFKKIKGGKWLKDLMSLNE